MPSTSSFELRAVTIYPGEREFLAQFIEVTLVALGVNGLLEDDSMLEEVELLSNRVGARRCHRVQLGSQ